MAWKPYTIDGKRVPSVTTIISNCKIGGVEPLLIWANKCGLEGKSHREEADKAANAGTCAHEMIECSIRGIPFDESKYPPDTVETAKPCFAAFLKWRQQTKLDLVESEVRLVSRKHMYGGTMDALAMEGTLILGDWKTSNGIYPDYIVQLAAYKNLWEENYPDRPIEGGAYLLRISKQADEFDPISFSYHYWDNLNLGWEAFLRMRELYELHKRLKGLC